MNYFKKYVPFFTRIFENQFFNATNIVNSERNKNRSDFNRGNLFQVGYGYSLVNCEHTLLLEKRTIASNLKFNEWN